MEVVDRVEGDRFSVDVGDVSVTPATVDGRRCRGCRFEPVLQTPVINKIIRNHNLSLSSSLVLLLQTRYSLHSATSNCTYI